MRSFIHIAAAALAVCAGLAQAQPVPIFGLVELSGAGATSGTLMNRTRHLQLLTEFSLDYRLTAKNRRALWLLTRARYFAHHRDNRVCRIFGHRCSPHGLA